MKKMNIEDNIWFTSDTHFGHSRIIKYCERPFTDVRNMDDMLIIKGINVFPAAVKNVIAGFSPRVTGEFRILLEAPGPRVEPPMRIRTEYGKDVDEKDLPSLKKEIEDTLSDKLKCRANIEWVEPGSLERMSGATRKGKLIEKLYES